MATFTENELLDALERAKDLASQNLSQVGQLATLFGLIMNEDEPSIYMTLAEIGENISVRWMDEASEMCVFLENKIKEIKEPLEKAA